jgi:hypothetical protein
MIDPNAVTNLARTDPELEEFLLFCIVVAGKNADQQARKLEDFLRGRKPFRFIRSLARPGELTAHLRRVRLGKYALLSESFRRLAHAETDLRTCSWQDLTRFPGIGPKTAKFFVLHSRPCEMHGVLDTHVLSWMRERQNVPGSRLPPAPLHSPQNPAVYAFWETVYFGLVSTRHHRGASDPPRPIDWAQVDLDLWKERRAM